MTIEPLEDRFGTVMTQSEVASYLRVDRKTIAKNPSRYGGIKLGRIWRYFSSEVEKAIEAEIQNTAIHRKLPHKSAGPDPRRHR